MKKRDKPKPHDNLDKRLFEAGLQCHKRLWLDYHQPLAERPSASRLEMSRVGDEMRALARTAFPMGVAIDCENDVDAAAQTQQLLDDDTPVLFNAVFIAGGISVQCDILVVHKDKQVDLFEIKSGTKVKLRYINDLALQAIVLGQCGLKLKIAYLLHINSQYAHQEGEDYPPMQLLRSADVTAKVNKQVPNVKRRLKLLRGAIQNKAAPRLPMGTFCKSPFPCPHMSRCEREAPELPLYQLPELTRQQEISMHKDGIEELTGIDDNREGLTFRQRRTLACMQQQERIVEPFVAEELRACIGPLHFIAVASVTDPLPRFEKQRPWQLTPYAWAVETVHEDGRIEHASFAHIDRSDPRGPFLKSLARHVEAGGTLLSWRGEPMRELRSMLDSVPDDKASVRALQSFEHVDIMRLLEAGVFDPQLLTYSDFQVVVQSLLDNKSGQEIEALDANYRYEALQKARTPRVRAATRDKISTSIQAGVSWQATRLRELFEMFAEAPADTSGTTTTTEPNQATDLATKPPDDE